LQKWLPETSRKRGNQFYGNQNGNPVPSLSFPPCAINKTRRVGVPAKPERPRAGHIKATLQPSEIEATTYAFGGDHSTLRNRDSQARCLRSHCGGGQSPKSASGGGAFPHGNIGKTRRAEVPAKPELQRADRTKLRPQSTRLEATTQPSKAGILTLGG
jgi:hypothetical protein